MRKFYFLLAFLIATACQNSQSQKKDSPKPTVEKPVISSEIAALNTPEKREAFLVDIFKKDQNFRKNEKSSVLQTYGSDSEEYRDFIKQYLEIDETNREKIHAYLQKFGYPIDPKFSREAKDAPWLVIHHMTDVQQRKSYFPYLDTAFHQKALNVEQLDLYLGRTYEFQFGEYPHWKTRYKPIDKVEWLIEELELKSVSDSL